MVEENVEWKQLFKSFKIEKLKERKRFALAELESYFIDKFAGVTNYEKKGGYQGLYRLLKEKEREGEIVFIKSSPYNSRRPTLKTRWQLVDNIDERWEEKLIFKLSRLLDLNYYLKRPYLQTEELAIKLKKITKFLAEKTEREWASREERSLEVFADEKFLASSKGKKLLSRLNLSLADIKAEKYSQMFVYWNRGTFQVSEVLILENHSAFIACKRAIESGFSIFSYRPDTLIYGEGKHIIDSLKFLTEIADLEQVKLKYAGDIDPEGLAIYTSLKERYPNLLLKLHLDYYKKMLLLGGDGYPLLSKQQKNKTVLDKVVAEFKNKEEDKLAEKIENLWETDIRIPQELITYYG